MRTPAVVVPAPEELRGPAAPAAPGPRTEPRTYGGNAARTPIARRRPAGPFARPRAAVSNAARGSRIVRSGAVARPITFANPGAIPTPIASARRRSTPESSETQAPKRPYAMRRLIRARPATPHVTQA